MKVVQVPMDEGLLKAINHRAKASRSTRAALIRVACHDYLRRVNEQELEHRYIEGYTRKAESPEVGEIGARLAEEVWPQEEWPEEDRDAAW